MFKLFSLLALVLLCLSACRPTRHNNNKNIDNIADTVANNPQPIDSARLAQLLQPDPFSSLVEIETNLGTLKIELFFHTPNHRENFLNLARQNAYSGILFHRVIKGFMAQAGDPNSKNARPNSRLGAGNIGPDQAHEINNQYFHVRGALAAARTPDEVNPEKKSSGSQFYIVDGRPVASDQLDRNERKYHISYTPDQRLLYRALGGAPQLDMEYTVFGRVYEGLNALDSIMVQPCDGADRPSENIKIIAVRILKS